MNTKAIMPPKGKGTHSPWCQLCKIAYAGWAMQYMDGPDKPPICIALGSHYRGYRVIKVCWECAQASKPQAIIT